MTEDDRMQTERRKEDRQRAMEEEMERARRERAARWEAEAVRKSNALSGSAEGAPSHRPQPPPPRANDVHMPYPNPEARLLHDRTARPTNAAFAGEHPRVRDAMYSAGRDVMGAVERARGEGGGRVVGSSAGNTTTSDPTPATTQPSLKDLHGERVARQGLGQAAPSALPAGSNSNSLSPFFPQRPLGCARTNQPGQAYEDFYDMEEEQFMKLKAGHRALGLPPPRTEGDAIGYAAAARASCGGGGDATAESTRAGENMPSDDPAAGSGCGDGHGPGGIPSLPAENFDTVGAVEKYMLEKLAVRNAEREAHEEERLALREAEKKQWAAEMMAVDEKNRRILENTRSRLHAVREVWFQRMEDARRAKEAAAAAARAWEGASSASKRTRKINEDDAAAAATAREHFAEMEDRWREAFRKEVQELRQQTEAAREAERIAAAEAAKPVFEDLPTADQFRRRRAERERAEYAARVEREIKFNEAEAQQRTGVSAEEIAAMREADAAALEYTHKVLSLKAAEERLEQQQRDARRRQRDMDNPIESLDRELRIGRR